jgi:hypothetical protein
LRAAAAADNDVIPLGLRIVAGAADIDLGGEEPDIADIMLRAGIGAAGQVDVERLVEVDPRIEIAPACLRRATFVMRQLTCVSCRSSSALFIIRDDRTIGRRFCVPIEPRGHVAAVRRECPPVRLAKTPGFPLRGFLFGPTRRRQLCPESLCGC